MTVRQTSETSTPLLCPDRLPEELRHHLQGLVGAWVRSPIRPIIPAQDRAYWDELVRTRAEDSTLPLYIRYNQENRGFRLMHKDGRVIVPVDNGPAHWVLVRALLGMKLTIEQVRGHVEADEIPVAMMLKRKEGAEAHYRCTRQDPSLTNWGWKVCHIQSIGFRRKLDPQTYPIGELKAHFIKFVSPSNMFVVPKKWGGLGELPDMIDAARAEA